MSDDTILRVDGVTKTFGDEVAVDDLSFTVEEGDIKSILGPSGCGKTTTLRMIAGLARADSGTLSIDGEVVSAPEEGVHARPMDRDIGMVFQSYAIWPHMTVGENVMYPLKAKKIGSKEERPEKVATILEEVGLRQHQDDLATNLSGGQQQRVALARALVVEPKILLFDEPLSNLDAKLRREMRLKIEEVCREFDITALYVTHSQDEAMFLSDEIGIMNRGRIVEEGHPNELHIDPENFFTMQFMGRCNILEGEIVSVDDQHYTVKTALGDARSLRRKYTFTEGDKVIAAFRPKFCKPIVSSQESVNNGAFVLEGDVNMTAPTQDFIEYALTVDDQDIVLRNSEPVDSSSNSIRFSVDTEDIKLFPVAQKEAVTA